MRTSGVNSVLSEILEYFRKLNFGYGPLTNKKLSATPGCSVVSAPLNPDLHMEGKPALLLAPRLEWP